MLQKDNDKIILGIKVISVKYVLDFDILFIIPD